MTHTITEQEMVSCGCGDMYAPMTFGAAWIYATGKCENCCAAEDAAPVQPPEPDLNSMRAAQKFLEWNRSADGGMVKQAYEYAVFEKARHLLANHASAKR